ncbi:MAG: UMP kinase [Ignavibacteria bacterium]|nr:UMP kinase [Ignavibacteria bacterium]
MYNRILLKLSGESLTGKQKFGIDSDSLNYIAAEVAKIANPDIQIAIVIGGGNIYRGLSASRQGVDRITADNMGMLATLINSLALQNALIHKGVPSVVQSAIKMEQICEYYIIRNTMKHLEEHKVVIFSGGTGNPYFSTDTAAALRAIEIKADILLKGTRVDGVYDKDPETNFDAKFFRNLTFVQVLDKGLRVMDLTAFTLCRENKMPVQIFNMNKEDNLKKVISGKKVGTTITI